MWQTSGAPHQLHIVPAARQPAAGPVKKNGVPGRRKVSLVPQDAESGRRSSMACILTTHECTIAQIVCPRVTR